MPVGEQNKSTAMDAPAPRDGSVNRPPDPTVTPQRVGGGPGPASNGVVSGGPGDYGNGAKTGGP